MEKDIQKTRERILQAATVLMKVHGFKGVTTKAIAAEAGVNEVTLFRHFGSKKAILEAIIEQWTLDRSVLEQVKQQVSWELEGDLHLFASAYQTFVREHQEIIMIIIKEISSFPGLDEKWAAVPGLLKQLILEYLKEMRAREEIVDTNLEAQALAFLWMNMGMFMSQCLLGERMMSMQPEEFLDASIRTFVRGLQR